MIVFQGRGTTNAHSGLGVGSHREVSRQSVLPLTALRGVCALMVLLMAATLIPRLFTKLGKLFSFFFFCLAKAYLMLLNIKEKEGILAHTE